MLVTMEEVESAFWKSSVGQVGSSASCSMLTNYILLLACGCDIVNSIRPQAHPVARSFHLGTAMCGKTLWWESVSRRMLWERVNHVNFMGARRFR
jgi:hypothetical protein